MILRIADIIEESITDGPGLRLTVFAQGCWRNCEGCHNPGTHDYFGGRETDTRTLIEILKSNPLLDGLSLSGGEPFDQAPAFAELAGMAKELNYNVMAWSGYTFEELIRNPEQKLLLEKIDALVDGPFILGQRSLNLLWRGSSNQRVLNVPLSLASMRAVEVAV